MVVVEKAHTSRWFLQLLVCGWIAKGSEVSPVYFPNATLIKLESTRDHYFLHPVSTPSLPPGFYINLSLSLSLSPSLLLM
jgi:hypothetical protein